MDSMKDWKKPAGMAAITLLGILLALYGMAPVRQHAQAEAAASAPALELELTREVEPPSNEIGDFQQLD
jgi:hypothetical protein